jgi:hypothetical protein
MLGSSSKERPSRDIKVDRDGSQDDLSLGIKDLGSLTVSGCHPPTRHESPYIDTHLSHIAGAESVVDDTRLTSRESRFLQAKGEIVYHCEEATEEFSEIHKMLGLSSAALVCRVRVQVRGSPLTACMTPG